MFKVLRNGHTLHMPKLWCNSCWTSNLEPRRPRTSNLAPRTSNLEPRTSNFGPRTSNLEPRTSNQGFFLQVQVWCGPTVMVNMMAAAPLTVDTLHIDMDVMPDTSLVRVTTYIPGGATLMSSRVLTVTCMRSVMEAVALSELRRRFVDLLLVGFHLVPVHQASSWSEPVLTTGKEKMVLVGKWKQWKRLQSH